MLLGKSREIAPERELGQSGNIAQLCMCLVVKVKSDAVKNSIALGTLNVRSVNQGKLDMVKQEMARVNINILGISEVKWTGMGKFNSHDHYIYYCGQIRSDQISRSVVSDLKTQPPLTNAFPPISHYFSFLPAPFHPIPLSFLSFLSCCSSFSDAPVIANTGQKPLRAMV